MQKRFALLTCLTLLFGLAGLGAGCSVAFEDAETPPPGKFPCNSDSDCQNGQNQVCDTDQAPADSEFAGTCVEDTQMQETDCIDEDGDGYGANEDDLSACPACREDRPGGCERDCDDGNKKINPGAAEVCNGTDDNCNGESDEPTPCESVSDCTILEGSQVQENTQFDCKEVGGSSQCVLVGANQQTTICQNAHATCQMNGTYGMVPEECTTF